jgi:hypothetical protein
VAVLDHPGAFSGLTLAGTRPVARGKTAADIAVARAEIRGDDPVAARAIARDIPGARLLVLEEAATAIPLRPPPRLPRRCSHSGGGLRLVRGEQPSSRPTTHVVQNDAASICVQPDGRIAHPVMAPVRMAVGARAVRIRRV